MITDHTLSLNHCQVNGTLPLYLRLGVLKSTNNEKPALWPIDWSKPLLLQHTQADYLSACALLEYWALQIMLQTLTTQLHVALFDSGLQQTFQTLEQIRLQTEYKAVITLTDFNQQAEYLKQLTEKARLRKGLLSQSECSDWQAYQLKFKNAEPYFLCVISDVSKLLQESDIASLLMELLAHAPRLGIVLWLLVPPSQEWKGQGNSYQIEEAHKHVKHMQQLSWVVALENNSLEVTQCNNISSDWSVINWFGVQPDVVDEKSKKHAVNVISARFAQQENPSGSDFIKIRIGLHEGKPFYLRIGEASDVYHGLIAGAAGTGKTSFLNQLICQICETHTPEQIQLFLFDYKEGVSFGLFEGMAHVPVLLLDNDLPETMLHYLDVFKKEIARRAIVFREKGRTIDKISKYNAIAEQPMPHWLMIVDEVQSLFESPTFTIKNEVSDAIKEVARKGRSFGLHLLFSTQSYRGVDFDAAAKAQMRLRISFRLNNAMECYALFNRDNEAPLKLPQFCAIYNAEDGDIAANRMVVMDYLDTSEIDERMDVLRELYPLLPQHSIDRPLTVPQANIQAEVNDSPLSAFKGLM